MESIRIPRTATHAFVTETLKRLAEKPHANVSSLMLEQLFQLDTQQDALLRRFVEANTSMEYLHLRANTYTLHTLIELSHALRVNRRIEWLAIDDSSRFHDKSTVLDHLAATLRVNPHIGSTWAIFVDAHVPIDCFVHNDLPDIRARLVQ
jgi:hypothetical protein